MSSIALRDTSFLAKALEGIQQTLQLASAPFEPAFIEKHRPSFKTDRLLTTDQQLLGRALSVGTYMKWAALEHAAGEEPAKIRAIYRSAAEAWLPVLEDLDFEPRENQSDGWVTPSNSESIIERFGGDIIGRKGSYVRCRWTARPQPFRMEVQKAFECAAISGDRDLARRLGRAYVLHEPRQYTAQYAIREAILRHLLADDDVQAQQLAKHLNDGYPADWPPHRTEFPQGIVNVDGRLLAEGLKAVNTRFKSLWDEGRYRKKYQHTLSKSSRSTRRQPTWDEFLDNVRGELVGLRWTLSTWALAFLNIAAWRGMASPFDHTKRFSEWVPLGLAKS